MLGIDRKDGNLILRCQAVDEFACHDERFLVGKRNDFLCLDGTDGWSESCKSHHGCQDDIDVVVLHHVAQGIGTCIYLDGQIGQCSLHGIVVLLVGYDHHFGLKPASLLYE